MIKEWLTPHERKITEVVSVKRTLPFRGGRGVGPFIFLDHMGPYDIQPFENVDVGVHPHIGLSTLTYLFEGEIEHRDSLGTIQRIRAGDVNWMTAGKGIAHSERTPKELLSTKRRMHGLQAWVALPIAQEECAPTFEHVESENIPKVSMTNADCRIVVGEFFGKKSPVKVYNRVFYVHVEMLAQGAIEFFQPQDEVAFYLVSGQIEVDGKIFQGPGLLLLDSSQKIRISSASRAMGMLLGGEPLAEHRTIWWNFVASKKELIQTAKENWKHQNFDKVPGEKDYIPLPD